IGWAADGAGVPTSQHPLPLIPPHRVLEGRLWRPPAIAELADGLVAREVHAMPGHAHALDREARGAVGEARKALGQIGERQDAPVRQADARRTAAGEARDPDQNLAQRPVLPTEDITPAEAAALQRHEVPGGVI